MKKTFVQIQLFDAIEMVEQISFDGRGKMSPVMVSCYKELERAGKFIRRPGGFWCAEDWKIHGLTFGTRTITALVSRGYAVLAGERQGKFGHYWTECYLGKKLVTNT